MNNNRTAIIAVTSIVCLLPIVLTIPFYGELPDTIAIHWNSAGVADSYLPKWAALFGLPVLLAVFNVFSQMYRMGDPKIKNVSAAMTLLRNWLPGVLSVVMFPTMLFIALGYDIPVVMIGASLVGVVLIICGNYLPKSRQNYTVGIKLPWTLSDVNNWNKTHLMAGRLWIAGGLVMIVSAFLLTGNPLVFLILIVAVIIVIVLLPAAYSYFLFVSSKRDGQRQKRQ
jgi:uncharacterized membrane protein